MYFTIVIVFCLTATYAKNKKEQILQLTFSRDSLNTVLLNERNMFNDINYELNETIQLQKSESMLLKKQLETKQTELTAKQAGLDKQTLEIARVNLLLIKKEEEIKQLKIEVDFKKIVCSEKEQKSQNSEDPILTKTCLLGIYKSTSTGEADDKGRYYYSYKLEKKINDKFTKIKNIELFNEKKSELLDLINKQIKKDFNEFSKDPEYADCFAEMNGSPKVSYEDLGITFTDSGIEFNISYGLSDSCLSVDGTTVSFKVDEILPYLNTK